MAIRIIPARAGFTGFPHCYSREYRDHPRSRGVYIIRVTFGYDTDGSSPLARGLLRARGTGVARRRIIPARAGFTSGTGDRPRQVGDHPRSRGVYPGSARVGIPGRGSSPLARGLLYSHDDIAKRFGIIPARAGFTQYCLRVSDRGEDHPRSRGVYPT